MTRLILQPRKVEQNLDHLFHNLFGNNHVAPFCSTDGEMSTFNPKVNIVEKDDSISLTFELPGLDKSQIKVLVKDKMLTVSGERKFETEEKATGYIRTEIASGSFSRSFNLPDTIEQDSVNADYKNGLLHVTLAKKEESKPKEIEVQIS